MKKVSKKDVKSVIESESKRSNKQGKVTRKSDTRKQGEREQAYNTFWVCDSERKQASADYLAGKVESLKGLLSEDFDFVNDKTQGFTILLASESESNDKYRDHIEIGRKLFGTLDYYPVNLEGLLTILEGARLALKEERVSKQEQEREQAREQARLAGASELSIEQLQAILSAKLEQASK